MFATLASSLIFTANASSVTSISLLGSDVYVGRQDGEVDRLGRDLVVKAKLGGPSGVPVAFIAASPYGVAWLSGRGSSIREKDAPAVPTAMGLTIETGGRARELTIEPESPIRRLAWLNGRVVVSFDFGSICFDGSGHRVEPSAFMPSDASVLASKGSLWVREQEDGTELAVFARPYSVRRDPRNQRAPLVSLFTAYQVGAWQWAKLGGFASNAFDAFPDGELVAGEDGRLADNAKFIVLSDRVALSQDGVVAREPDSLMSVPVTIKNWETSRIDAAPISGDPLWFGASGGDAWWWNGSVLVEQDRRSGKYWAYVPWDSPSGFSPICFAAGTSGLWIGSKEGLGHLDPGAPDAGRGFAGLLRIPFGGDSEVGADPVAKKLMDAVFAWRFAGVDKAGADGAVMVASVFSALGLQIPQTAAELLRAGTPVNDELRLGDVLVTPKSAAIYLGNGVTVGVRDGRVQNGDVWSLVRPAVRRYLP